MPLEQRESNMKTMFAAFAVIAATAIAVSPALSKANAFINAPIESSNSVGGLCFKALKDPIEISFVSGGHFSASKISSWTQNGSAVSVVLANGERHTFHETLYRGVQALQQDDPPGPTLLVAPCG